MPEDEWRGGECVEKLEGETMFLSFSISLCSSVAGRAGLVGPAMGGPTFTLSVYV